MFCRNCGQTILETTPFCGQCGTAVVAPGVPASRSGTGAAAAVAPAAVNLTKSIRDEVQSRTKDAWQGIKLFIKSPVGGLQESFEMFEPSRAMSVGVVFALLYEIMTFFGIYRLASTASSSLGLALPVGDLTAKQLFQLAFVGLVPFATLTASSAIARKVFRGQGTLAGDVYTAGASLLPLGFLVLLASLLGPANIEVILALAVFAVTYQILMLYAGCSRIAGIPEAGAAPAVPVMLMLSMWLTKVVIASMFTL